MIDRDLLLKDTRKLVNDLVEDLRERTDEFERVRDYIRVQYSDAREAGRTDRSYEEWREDVLAQVAVGWVLASVFVRFCEDNRLYDLPLLSGPGGRRDLAGDHRADWLAEHREAGDRDWLQEVFGRYRNVPAIADLFGEYNPLWQFGPTDDGARAILDLWTRLDTRSGDLCHDFTDPNLDTRFLGDLYQDLSEHAKKTYALLQTPEFVEEFILERTLDPAVETFGLEGVKMIDPTCGSGHFLLGGFDRLLGYWKTRMPGHPTRDLVQRALTGIYGIDLNPFAVEIARFRLIVAALKASEIGELRDAPAFQINVAAGDSLIHGRRSGQLFSGTAGLGPLLRHRYPSEDHERADAILESGGYHAVVGNPPYITPKDKALRDAYRDIYDTAYMQYSLGVPFTERFFDLAVTPEGAGDGGFVGMITTNTFMKRSFGRKLVKEFLPTVDLTHVIDTSGAYIPGHGTPTVILVGRHRQPASRDVRSVLGIRGEPGRPDQPREGKVWKSIVRLVDQPGAENAYLSVEDQPRSRYSRHPWSLQGGAAPETKTMVERAAPVKLGSWTIEIGSTAYTRADDLYVAPEGTFVRQTGRGDQIRPFVTGSDVRDWIAAGSTEVLFPYDQEEGFEPALHGQRILQLVWPFRTLLWERKEPNGTVRDLGMEWFEWARFLKERLDSPLLITFAFVATHNHFVLERGGKVFKQSAPVIKLPAGRSEEDHTKLLGLLNSSTASFWMKQVFHCKGSTVDQRGARQTTVPFEDFYEFDSTKLKEFPIPDGASAERAKELDQLAQRLNASLPAMVVEEALPNRDRLDEARRRAAAIRARMVAVQEELDWECYHLYGLTDEELTAPDEEIPDLEKGQRAFEIVLARKMAAGESDSTWFERHSSAAVTEVPGNWPEQYRQIVERRIELIETHRSIRLLEKPEHKRRWNWDSWEELQNKVLQRWLLGRLEAEELWVEPELTTTARLADRVRREASFLEAAKLYSGRSDVDLTELVTELVLGQAVPFAVGYRFNASGLRFRREWERVWDLQREEDAIDSRTELPEDDPNHLTEAETELLKEKRGLDNIPVPPKYRKSDYSDETAYQLRGRLDVPQERFISYPGTRKGADTTPVIGWAGWDHLERTQALAGQYAARKDQGAEAAELVGLLAGLQEMVPWLKQWHNEVDPAYGQRMGDFFASFVESEAKGLGRTVEDLKTWTP